MAAWALDWVAANWGPEFRQELAACLLLEEASRNTAASATNTLPLAKRHNLRAVGLVSDGLHIRRAHYLFQRQFDRHDIAVQPLPARGLLRHYGRQRHYLRLAKILLREGGAWLKVLTRLPGRRHR